MRSIPFLRSGGDDVKQGDLNTLLIEPEKAIDVHTVVAFLTIAFVIVHIYMATMGETVFGYIMAMIPGREEMEQQGCSGVPPLPFG